MLPVKHLLLSAKNNQTEADFWQIEEMVRKRVLMMSAQLNQAIDQACYVMLAIF